ncbi:MAG: DEAD/DEAH box helicase [Neisseriaceae bacterium]|nr:DEAD/DEAH box helicase [Neisseriaceae bacterium]
MENLDIFEKCFEKCRIINSDIEQGNEEQAREKLIQLLDDLNKNNISYEPIVNHLIRQTGLYPYIQTETAHWEDRFVKEVFKVDTGAREPQTLHREQSALLKKLLNGTDIVVSAPTSFGKSFIIDAFITIKNPTNVVIIVPTIALTDETRRRLHRKFADKYKIITHSDIELGEKNIFIFPQERAISYINKIPDIDIFIVDEFYKADSLFDDRASILQKVIIEFSIKSQQRYFLAPNIPNMEHNLLIKDMDFINKLDFNTVYTDTKHSYEDENFNKQNKLLEIINSNNTKSIIYVGTLSENNNVANILNGNLQDINDEILNQFSDWLKINYCQNYILADLVKKGCGVHNGKLHRSLSQLQVYLFSEKNINNLISTSSIIEGVNTSAENVIIWKNKIARKNLDTFTYKNIIGRSGRMFKYFIGKIYLLERPPEDESIELPLNLEDDVICSLDNEELLNEQQKGIAQNIHSQLKNKLGDEVYNRIISNNLLKSYNKSDLEIIIDDMVKNKREWENLDLNSLNYISNNNMRILKNIIIKFDKENRRRYASGDPQYTDKYLYFISTIKGNWNNKISDLISQLQGNYNDFNIENFFEFERKVIFNLSTLLK